MKTKNLEDWNHEYLKAKVALFNCKYKRVIESEKIGSKWWLSHPESHHFIDIILDSFK